MHAGVATIVPSATLDFAATISGFSPELERVRDFQTVSSGMGDAFLSSLRIAASFFSRSCELSLRPVLTGCWIIPALWKNGLDLLVSVNRA